MREIPSWVPEWSALSSTETIRTIGLWGYTPVHCGICLVWGWGVNQEPVRIEPGTLGKDGAEVRGLESISCNPLAV